MNPKEEASWEGKKNQMCVARMGNSARRKEQ
jgi:hypothetical protein